MSNELSELQAEMLQSRDYLSQIYFEFIDDPILYRYKFIDAIEAYYRLEVKLRCAFYAAQLIEGIKTCAG